MSQLRVTWLTNSRVGVTNIEISGKVDNCEKVRAKSDKTDLIFMVKTRTAVQKRIENKSSDLKAD